MSDQAAEIHGGVGHRTHRSNRCFPSVEHPTIPGQPRSAYGPSLSVLNSMFTADSCNTCVNCGISVPRVSTDKDMSQACLRSGDSMSSNVLSDGFDQALVRGADVERVDKPTWTSDTRQSAAIAAEVPSALRPPPRYI